MVDPEKGSRLDLSPWLQRGDNPLDVGVRNFPRGGDITLLPVAGWRRVLLAAGLLLLAPPPVA